MKAAFVAVLAIALIVGVSVAEAHKKNHHDSKSKSKDSAQCDHALFEQFKAKHGRSYATLKEHKHRFGVFCDNLERIAKLNKANAGSATFGINKFADMTPEEFAQAYKGMNALGRPASRQEVSAIFTQSCLANGVTAFRHSEQDLPASFDWVSQGKVSKVKDQGGCGSCWTFSTTGNIESQWAIKNNLNQNNMVLLSEQAIVDCSTACCNVTRYGSVCNQGCNGGWPWAAMADVKSWGGLPTEAAYPYKGEDGTCAIRGKQLLAPISNVTCLSGPNSLDETQMQAWLVNHGPLSIALNAEWLQLYEGGVLTKGVLGCDGHSLDHAVLAVGYGTASGVFGTTPFWTVKNSWGESWGEKGYFRIQRGIGLCGINNAVSTVFM